MLIIRDSALMVEGDKFLYQNENFEGVSLLIVNGLVTQKKLYKDGVFDGNYISPYISVDDLSSHIDSEKLDDEYEDPCTQDGSLYSGVAYRFVGDVCVSELEYKQGWLSAEVNYRRNGDLESIDVGGDDLSQKCSWFEDGNIEEFESFERSSYRSWLKFTKKDVVTTIVIEGDYFNRIEQIKDRLTLDMFNKKYFAVNLIADEYLFLSGDGVNDDVFSDLLAQDGLKETLKLNISKTRLTSLIMEKLIPLKNIGQLIIESEYIDLDCLKSFKSQRPDCFVELNREEVSV